MVRDVPLPEQVEIIRTQVEAIDRRLEGIDAQIDDLENIAKDLRTARNECVVLQTQLMRKVAGGVE